MCYPHFKRHQGGAALIVALLVFAIASALLVALQRDFTLHMQRGSNYLAGEQGWSYLLGAEALGMVALRLDAQSDANSAAPVDHLGELWAGEATPYPLAEGGWLVGKLEDLQGRFNLNSLVDVPEAGDGTPGEDSEEALTVAAGEAAYSEAQKQFVRLLLTLEGTSINIDQAISIMEAVADFIDDDVRKRLNGAEDEAYLYSEPTYRTSGRPLASVSELRGVAGISPEIYRALAPLVTVWPRQGGALNILTAPSTVLRSLGTGSGLEPLSEADGQRLVTARREGMITSIDELMEDVAFSAEDSGKLRDLLVESSSWFLLSATVEIADRELRLYSVLERDGEVILPRYRSTGEL